MALIFELLVETNGNQIQNLKVKEYFESFKNIETYNKSYPIWTRLASNDIGVCVSVDGISRSGIYAKDVEDATNVGFQFYKLLKQAPEFRYAIVGVEANEWVEGNDILAPDFDGYLQEHGLVINTNFISPLEFDFKFEEFKPGYQWVPYLGEENQI